MHDDIQVFAMAGAGAGSLRLPVERARTVVEPQVLESEQECGDGGPGPLLVVDASDPGAPVATFPYAPPLVDVVRAPERWSGLPPHPLPATGWHELDESWWCDLVVRGAWVYVAQTDCDDILELLGDPGVDTLHWTAPGLAWVDDATVTWSRVLRAEWDDAWRRACAMAVGTPRPGGRDGRGRVAVDGERGPSP